MATFVIVHGAWGGGWEWTPVARLLRDRGHDVFTPTLSGMGERAHICRDQRIGLDVHIGDVLAVLELEALTDVVLVGASFGGMPVTGAADRAPQRLRSVVYVDALVPADGQAAIDLLPAPFASAVRSGTDEHGESWRVPIPDELLDALVPPGSLPEETRTSLRARLRDHPAASFLDAIHLAGAADQLPKAFVRCTTAELSDALGGDPIDACAERARNEGWIYRELATPHDPQIFDPPGIAAILVEIADETI